MLGEGKDVADVCRGLQIVEQACSGGRNQLSDLKADDANALKDLKWKDSTFS